MTIQRYEVKSWNEWDGASLTLSDDGDYVFCADHLAVLAEKDAWYAEQWKFREEERDQKEVDLNRQIADLEKVVKVFQDDTLMRTTHIAHLEGQIAALTAKPVTLTNYHNEDITFTGKKKKGNVLVTTCGHDPLANAIPCATCALEQIAALEAEVKEKDEKWEARNKDAMSYVDQINELRGILDEKEEQIAALTADIAMHEHTLGRANDDIAALTAERDKYQKFYDEAMAL